MEKYFDTGDIVKIKDRTSPYYNCEGVVMGPITGSNSVLVNFGDDSKFAFDKKFIEPKVKVTKSDYYDDSMRMDDAEKLFGQIKAECEGCTAWSGTDCTRNPITEGCLKDLNENNICLVGDTITPKAMLKASDTNEPIIIKMDNNIENYEMVNHPKHYRPGTYEAINVIEAWDLNFSLGSAIKYISRCGLKPDASLDNKYKAIEDLRKAAWYINREIERIDKTTVKNS